MDRAEFLKKATAGAAGLALGTTAISKNNATAQAASRPNILLIMTDDQPFHTLGMMDSVRQRLVDNGMLFTNGYVATPICGPARGSVLTGKWSHNTGLEDTVGAWQDLVNSGELAHNIGKRLKAAGYACHLTGKFTNGLRNGNWVCPGFDSWWAQLEGFNNKDHMYFSKGGEGRMDIPRNGTQAGNETLVAASYTERFIRNHKGAPWFACFWPHAPHGPYYPLDRYAGTHRGQTPPTPFGEPGGDLSDKAPLVRELARRSDADKTDMMQEYRGKLREVEEVDDAVGRLMTTLVETNQLDNTWIFFLTDNGFQHGEHFLDKKLWPYEESARTPFVVRGPAGAVPGGTTNGHLVSQIDLLPTICEIAGANAGGTDGRSLLPILRNPGALFREFLLVEAEGRGWHSVRMRRWNPTRARHDDLLFVKWNGGFEEIYDYDKDPNLFEGRVDIPREEKNVGMLRNRLLAMRTAAGAKYRALETN